MSNVIDCFLPDTQVCMNKKCVNVTTVYKSKCKDVCPTDQVCSEEGKCVCIDGNTGNCSLLGLQTGHSSEDNGNTFIKSKRTFFRWFSILSQIAKNCPQNNLM